MQVKALSFPALAENSGQEGYAGRFQMFRTHSALIPGECPARIVAMADGIRLRHFIRWSVIALQELRKSPLGRSGFYALIRARSGCMNDTPESCARRGGVA
jgi:hypothetical protein